ncbi:hypothetical protein [Nakamurella aerolata]|uniref:Uncharacterized protein n=1 Tax=Nakamurella aerolata TaxID=1656892 RepID=A0A849A501_9ACTN|nr:hypothetical protein [Nakamurella aerolata]NNG35615.1 hypothetical protein [Nakamurella aerolata]
MDSEPLQVLVADGPAPDGTAPDPTPAAGTPAAVEQILEQVRQTGTPGDQVHRVGSRPGKEIDPLLTGRLLVIGTDAALAAVVKRLQRRELLGQVQVSVAAIGDSQVARVWSLPRDPESQVRLARLGEVDVVPILRDDNGGVLVGEATIGPVAGTVYVDENRVVSSSARGLIVQPSVERGLQVTVIPKRMLGFGRRAQTYSGRAVEVSTLPGNPAGVVADGVRRDKDVERWTYYKHTAPLRLVRGVVD